MSKKNFSSLVRTATSDGLYLHGFFVPSKGKKALLHIHGFEGNFYENYFVHVLIQKMREERFAFLTANTRGNGRDTDLFITNGELKRVGARYELLEDAYKDIDSWIKFLEGQGYSEIILQGHSLGTVKVVRYLFEGKHKSKIKKLILLCPFDGKALINSFTKTPLEKLVTKAKEKIQQGKGDELITREFDMVDMSYNSYVSWYERSDFGRMFEFCNKNYDFPIIQSIKVPTKIIVGSKDEYFHLSNPNHPEEAMAILLKYISNSQGKIIPNARHSYIGFEEELVKEIVEFIESRRE